MLKKLIFLSLALTTCPAMADDQSETAGLFRQIAISYERGLDVKQDYPQAFAMYCQAALMGDAQAAYGLGFMYFNGRGVQKNLPLAGRWFREAANGGDAHGRVMLAKFDTQGNLPDPACERKKLPEIHLADVPNPNRQVIETWVNQIAPVYGIDPQLVMAVIQAESAFTIAALSNKNAQGLMQLIPETAARFGVKDSWNPVQNIKGGVAYLHWLMRHFDGKVDWVLAAYNAGEKAVERYKGIPPYQETQHYVKKILASYQKTTHPIPPEKNPADYSFPKI